MFKLLATSLLAGALYVTVPSNSAVAFDDTYHTNSVVVTVDQAKVFRVSRPAATIIVGNPAIVDATVEDEQTIVLTGRSFGVTNLIVLDIDGDAVVDQPVVVTGSEVNTVRIYRRNSRETLACAPVCEPTLTIGDNFGSFTASAEQIKDRNQLSEANAD
ncbi:MAG: pilus assembly protein N-terminal domain-containing protein [Pseudomonadota bacterium]